MDFTSPSAAPLFAASTPSPSASPDLIKAKDAMGFFFLLAGFVAVLALFYVYDRRRTAQRTDALGEPLLE